MKITYVICAFGLVACLNLEANAQTCPISGEYLPEGVHYRNCIKYTCSDGFVSAVGCAQSLCPPGKFREMVPLDLNKPYPECCPHPICNP